MHILILDAYFDPELTADTHLEHDLLEAFVAAGHEVNVLCPTPTRGISEEIRQKYRHIKREELYGGHVHVQRFWAPQEKQSSLLRALRYFWCNFRTYQMGKRYRDTDLIYSNSTPPTQGKTCVRLKKYLSARRGSEIPYLFYLQDIFPDTLVAAGLTRRDSLLWRIGRRMEDATYAGTSRIVVLSEGGRQNILEKGVPPEKVEVIYNWIDLQAVSYVKREENPLFDRYGLDRNGFYVVYAGNLGKAQNVDLLVDAARRLDGRGDIEFVIFGSGGEEEDLRRRIQREGVQHIHLLPLQPMEMAAAVYSMGDVDAVLCKKGFGLSALPSKTWSIMATERPVVASFDKEGDLSQVLAEHHCGVTAAADDLDEFVDAVLHMKEMPAEERACMGRSGRAYALAYREKKACTGQFVRLLQELS